MSCRKWVFKWNFLSHEKKISISWEKNLEALGLKIRDQWMGFFQIAWEKILKKFLGLNFINHWKPGICVSKLGKKFKKPYWLKSQNLTVSNKITEFLEFFLLKNLKIFNLEQENPGIFLGVFCQKSRDLATVMGYQMGTQMGYQENLSQS